jgi:hypothetical protein
LQAHVSQCFSAKAASNYLLQWNHKGN